ncbi:VCBS repeat-containing protein [Clostridium estertheticum]|uniref:VCBS repeat-containing protein n=1 Tax=Clostridium estertheticum TaxID=238834 RepID=A0AA47I6W6_9CLOT|nr:VCBS repeat-containing protein [Clostridium estertheticum]MBU3154417.1 VCBS repeat-containing protein [Clostridium estertheticum]MBU3197817.1 VCBS repeat-containing protein [Clostridium estertheticum]WAG60305.1 VCBS repeat-containing protein [Clostridium estertheticum]WAG65617.1 VCBS repeat-containing protein [Clostridium estertheticum]
MKLQIIFLKKKYIYYVLAIIIFTITLTFLLLFKTNAISTFNIINESKMMQADLTGDGNKDILYIKTDVDKYYIQINSGDKCYYLEPSKKLNTVGNYYLQWPMRLTLMDISRNNVPEIFTQASVNNKAVQHVFLWTGEKYEDIFSSTNNILGFVDSKNNKTPKMLSGNIKDGELNLISYIFIQDSLKSFDYNYVDNYMGKTTVLGFINLMATFPVSELTMPKDLFTSDLNGNDISLLSDLSDRKVHLTFQDAVFKDFKWDKDGNTSDVLWTLNFKGTNTNDLLEPNVTNLKESKNYTIELILKLIPNTNKDPSFKISSIDIK